MNCSVRSGQSKAVSRIWLSLQIF